MLTFAAILIIGGVAGLASSMIRERAEAIRSEHKTVAFFCGYAQGLGNKR